MVGKGNCGSWQFGSFQFSDRNPATNGTDFTDLESAEKPQTRPRIGEGNRILFTGREGSKRSGVGSGNLKFQISYLKSEGPIFSFRCYQIRSTDSYWTPMR